MSYEEQIREILERPVTQVERNKHGDYAYEERLKEALVLLARKLDSHKHHPYFTSPEFSK